MIYKLRRKFIIICILSFVAVFTVALGLIFAVTSIQTTRSLDKHADLISQNDGLFPDFGEIHAHNKKPPMPEGFNKESPFTTRYFSVRFDGNGNISRVDTRAVASVTEQQAETFAKKALSVGKARGWADNFRYKVYATADGEAVVFVSGINAIENNRSFLLSALTVFAVCSGVIILLIILISKRAVKPAAESYEKQKQFITNANHELKTPLTLIGTNLDILESEAGSNEWLQDIRDETQTMTSLVNRMVSLARMDEEGTKLEISRFNLSEATEDTVSAFETTAVKNGKKIKTNIKNGVIYTGDEASVRQVVSILMDNAVKYCDIGGEITVSLEGDKHPVFFVENSYSSIDALELDRVFDRFYRADKARTYGSGFGIGLSMAKAIVEKHKGSITVYDPGIGKIGFKVKL